MACFEATLVQAPPIEGPKYEVLNGEVRQTGSFCRIRIWIRGWHRELLASGWIVRFIWGMTGRETEISWEAVNPIRVFEYTSSHELTAQGGQRAPSRTANVGRGDARLPDRDQTPQDVAA